MMRAERVIVRGSNRTHNYPIKHWHYDSTERALICEELEMSVCDKKDPTDCGLKDVEEPAQREGTLGAQPHREAVKGIERMEEEKDAERMAEEIIHSNTFKTHEIIKLVCRHDLREFKLRRRVENLEQRVESMRYLRRGIEAHDELVSKKFNDLFQRIEALKEEVAALNDFAIKIVKRIPKSRTPRKKK